MGRHGKKTEILEQGAALVHRAGFAATSVADITAAAGVPKGSFYNHFESKDAFGTAVLDRYFEDVRIALDETLHAAGAPALTRLDNYFRRLKLHVARDNFARGCLIGNISAEVSAVTDATRARLAELIREWTASLARCIEDGQCDGSIRRGPTPEALAVLLLDAWQGALLRAKVERRPAALDNFLDVLLPGLAPGRLK
jgi:TetR/AcrR family transcriptional repressor of nem operon